MTETTNICIQCPVSVAEIDEDRDDFWDALKSLFCDALDELRADGRS